MPVSSLVRLTFPALAAALLLGPRSLAAQAAPSRDSVLVAPNPDYSAGGLHRFFFGTRYRSLWTTPIKVPVLDLNRFAGGLTPTERGGGAQTKSLRFRGADGKDYQFRSVDKDPTGLLPEEMRNTFAADLLQDQMSAGHPAGAVVVPALLEAAGVLHPTPVLVQMPDDPKLGEHRREFARLLGTIEERPRGAEGGAGFEGATDVESTEDLWKELDKNPAVRVDTREFLLARLTDIFIGDWDRHQDQWRWALLPRRSGQGQAWRPIPRDRDQAFVRYDGFMLAQARRTAPQLLNFGDKYGDIVGHTWNGRDVDRRLLSDLEKPVYDSIAALLKSRLTDQAIANAVNRMPPEWQPLDAARLTSALKARRDRIDEIANRYYRLLADRVDIWATNEPDEAKVTRNADGSTSVEITAGQVTYYRRRFDPGETDEIRLYLQGGNDRVTVEGENRGSPKVRAIGGGGDDRYVITTGAGVKIYDDRGENVAEGKGINRKTWDPPVDTTMALPIAPRDWGKKTLTMPMLSAGPDIGVLVGWGGFTNWYGFRHLPATRRADYRLWYSTGRQSGRVSLGLTFYGENSKSLIRMKGVASGIEVLRWYGAGNETPASSDRRFHRLNQEELSFNLEWGYRWSEGNEFTIGPKVKYSNTDLQDEPNVDRFIAVDAPYGSEKFGMAAMSASLTLDSRDIPKFATRGARLSLEGMVVPELWDAVEMFGVAKAEGSISLAPGGSWQPSLNLMAGGAKGWGDLPFFEAPSLGGFRTLRGYPPNRFSGDASIYGSAEARIPLTRIRFFVPGQQGVFGFADAGRVYVDGETSDEMHSSFGGGIWLSFVERGNVLVAGVGVPANATGADKSGRFFLGFGFPY